MVKNLYGGAVVWIRGCREVGNARPKEIKKRKKNKEKEKEKVDERQKREKSR